MSAAAVDPAAVKTAFVNGVPADATRAETFFRALRVSRLLAPADVDALQAEYPPDKFDELRRSLVDAGILTCFQVDRLAAGDTAGLALGPYQILDEIGRGAFGRVFKARHTIMGRTVALKIIAPEWVQDAGARDLFLREMVASTRLTHPNVALAYDANEVGGVPYFAMEYVEGPTLDRYVADHGPLAVDLACAVAAQTAQALQAAHECGMVHRDIKPANLLLPGLAPAADRGPTLSGPPPVLVKIVDFGVARLYPREASQTSTVHCRTGLTMGSPAFMSPEQAHDVHDVDIRSDLYSLGCTLYFALTGRLPFRGGNVQELFAKVLTEEPAPVRTLRPDVPEGVAAIVRRLMAKRPEQRFQTPAEVVQALNFAVVGGRLRDSTPKAPTPPPPPGEQSEVSPHVEHRPADAAPPATPAASAADAYDLWREWCAVVECFVRNGVPDIGPDDYRVLHQALVRAAGGLADQPWRDAVGLVEPWLALPTIAGLERRTLLGLWRTCQEVDAAIAPPATGPRLGCWLLAGSLAAAAAAGWVLFR